MSHSIFVDTNRHAAILVNDDPIYALGPVIVADDDAEAVEALEGFLGALERDPTNCPTITLMTEWQGFLMALHGMVMGAPEAPPPGASADPMGSDGVDPSGDADEAQGAGEGAGLGVGPGEPDVELVAGAGAEPRPIPDDDDDDDDDTPELAGDELADRLANVPGGTPAQRGQVECWACGGDGQVDIAGEPQDCNVCGGTGRLAAA